MCRRPAHPLRSLGRLFCPSALAPKLLDAVLLVWQAMWVALFCYKMCWEILFQLLQQACSSMTLWLEDFGETHQGGEAPSSPAKSGPQESGAEEEGEARSPQAPSSRGVLARISLLETEVRYLSQELRAEKLLWSSRYLELLREQQALLAQLQGPDQSLWLQDPEGLSDGWGSLPGPRIGPWDPDSTARGVGTQTD